MPIIYKKLFHILLDRNIKDGEFRRMVNISAPTLAKLKNGSTITTEMIERICATLELQPGDMMEYAPPSGNDK